MRTIPSAAATEIAKKNGCFPVRILEVQWSESSTLYFSDRTLTAPVEASGTVASWGSVTCEGRADSIGGYGTCTVELVDTDYSIKTLFDTEPGPAAKRVFIHEFFAGTTWPTDRVTIFSGVTSGDVEFDASTAIWRLSLKGLEKYYDRSIGTPLTRDKFPSIQCTDHEGKIIPVVYGVGVKRVPARLIQMPGHAYLSEAANEHAETLELTKTCEEMGCEPETTVTLVVGVADFWENFTGYFESDSSKTFVVSSRGSVLASGESPGPYGSGGVNYFLVEKEDLPGFDSDEPTAELPSLAGYPIWYHDGDGWSSAFVIDNWIDNSSSVAVLREPNGVEFASGWTWKIGATPGLITQWPVSTPVQVIAPWIYAVSHLPSPEVLHVEVRARLQTSGGGRGDLKYYKLNPDRYTVNTDNKSFNERLGRDEEDPGITTITLDYPPTVHGFEDGVFVTLDGNESYESPGLIIKDMLTNKAIGNIPSENVNVSGDVTSVKLAFAITDEKDLHDTVSEIAYQGCCLLFWDQGGVNLKALTNELSGPVVSVTQANMQEQTLKLGHSAIEASHTCALAKFKPTCVNPEVKFFRKSTEAVDYYGERRKEVNCWAIQDPEQIVSVLEFWLKFYLSQHRTVSFQCFLDSGLKLQPGDTISVSFQNGAGSSLLNEQLARVTRCEHVFGDTERNQMETIAVEAEFSVWDYEIDDSTADLELCEGDGGNELPQPHEDAVQQGVGGLVLMAPNWGQLSTVAAPAASSGGGGGNAKLVRVTTANASITRGRVVQAEIVNVEFTEEVGAAGTFTNTGEMIFAVPSKNVSLETNRRYVAVKLASGQWVIDSQFAFTE